MCIGGKNFNPLDLLDLSGQAKRDDARDAQMSAMAAQIAQVNAEANAPKADLTTQDGVQPPEQTAASRNSSLVAGARNPLRLSVATSTATPGAGSGLNVPV